MQKSGVEIIAEERQQQIEEHGYTIEHDKHYTNNELLRAAMCYIQQCKYVGCAVWQDRVPTDWPFQAKYWKPRPYFDNNKCPIIDVESAIKMLSKAGAFIAAEIDRLKQLPQY